jgi:hypothetical protein
VKPRLVEVPSDNNGRTVAPRVPYSYGVVALLDNPRAEGVLTVTRYPDPSPEREPPRGIDTVV